MKAVYDFTPSSSEEMPLEEGQVSESPLVFEGYRTGAADECRKSLPTLIEETHTFTRVIWSTMHGSKHTKRATYPLLSSLFRLYVACTCIIWYE